MRKIGTVAELVNALAMDGRNRPVKPRLFAVGKFDRLFAVLAGSNPAGATYFSICWLFGALKMIVDGKQQVIDQLRELAEFFDDPKRSPTIGMTVIYSRVTPGFLLRRIADEYESVDSGAENVGSG